jgi:hypothetical protein
VIDGGELLVVFRLEHLRDELPGISLYHPEVPEVDEHGKGNGADLLGEPVHRREMGEYVVDGQFFDVNPKADDPVFHHDATQTGLGQVDISYQVHHQPSGEDVTCTDLHGEVLSRRVLLDFAGEIPASSGPRTRFSCTRLIR